MLPDLNLLPALQALLSEKNVTRAASKLEVTQSAMSRTFSRLKNQLNDPLMVRIDNQYELTPHGEHLHQALKFVMPEIKEIWRKPIFDPAKSNQNIHIGGTDMDIVLVRKRISRIQQAAPNLRLSIRSNNTRMIDDLISGEIDLLFTAVNDERAGLYRQFIASETYVAVVGKSNKLVSDSLDMDAYLQQRHGIFAFPEPTRSKVDKALEAKGLKRNVTFSLPTFSQIPPFLSDNSLIFSLPKSFAEYLSAYFPIRILPLPFEVETLKIYLYWHMRKHKSDLNQWVRSHLINKQYP